MLTRVGRRHPGMLTVKGMQAARAQPDVSALVTKLREQVGDGAPAALDASDRGSDNELCMWARGRATNQATVPFESRRQGLRLDTMYNQRRYICPTCGCCFTSAIARALCYNLQCKPGQMISIAQGGESLSAKPIKFQSLHATETTT